MRKIIFSILVVMSVLGCTKVTLTPYVCENPYKNKIEFNAVKEWNTKANINNSFVNGDKISIAAYQDNVLQFNDILSDNNNIWAMSESRYWDCYDAEFGGSKSLDFCFAYPTQTISNKSFNYTLSSNPSNQEDLLVKYLGNTRQPQNLGAVSMQMTHALSLIDFKAKAEESGYQYKIESITLTNTNTFYDSGTYTFGEGWTSVVKNPGVVTYNSPITVSNISSSEYTDINAGDYCLLIPQTVATLKISVAYSVVKDGNTLNSTCDANITNETYQEGKMYTYQMVLPAITSGHGPVVGFYVTKADGTYMDPDAEVYFPASHTEQLKVFIKYQDGTSEEISASECSWKCTGPAINCKNGKVNTKSQPDTSYLTVTYQSYTLVYNVHVG